MVYEEDETRSQHGRLYRYALHYKWSWTFTIVATWYGIRRRLDWKMTWLIVQVRSTSKSKLHYHDRLDKMRSILKSRQDNDVTDRIGITFVKCIIELSRPIRQDTVHLEKKTRQWCDRLYRCALRRMRYSTVKIDWIVYGLWWRWDKPTILAIIQVHSMLKMKLNCLVWFYRV